MDFDEFMENCSFDFEPKGKETQVVVIFSQGYLKDFNSDLVKTNPDVVKMLIAHELYGYIGQKFKEN